MAMNVASRCILCNSRNLFGIPIIRVTTTTITDKGLSTCKRSYCQVCFEDIRSRAERDIPELSFGNLSTEAVEDFIGTLVGIDQRHNASWGTGNGFWLNLDGGHDILTKYHPIGDELESLLRRARSTPGNMYDGH